ITPLPGTQVLARYQESYYKGEAALTENTVGKGKVLHFGSVFTKDNTLPILRHAGVVNLFSNICTAPETVEMVLREKEGKQYLFLLNFPNREAEITLHIPCKCLYTGDTLQGPVTLPPFGTLVLEM
ncbi:MAG: Beta-galactosidase C-terminal domain, partial [Clostridia bacterium]|nr:Beta-galactosidase C-terminal domain [Clostridia bacterium]